MKKNKLIRANIYSILHDASRVYNGVCRINEDEWPIDQLVDLVIWWQGVARYEMIEEAELLAGKKRKTND